MLRKAIVLLSLLSFITICSINLVKDNSVRPVFNKLDEYYYDLYSVDLSGENINTKNIFEYFSDIKVLKIYPKNNPIYARFINIDEYEFDSILSFKKNISNFITTYNNALKENALIKEAELFDVSGIKINKLQIYASDGQVEKLKEVLPNINIKTI